MQNQPESEKIHDFFFEAAITGSLEIRRKLGIDYSVKPIDTVIKQEPRKYYIHGVLNEVEKAAIYCSSEFRFLNDSLANQQEKLENMYEQHISSMALQGKVDCLGSWHRKLVEILVDLIGFSQVSGDDYYEHFIIVCKLDDRLSTQRVIKEFYQCDNQIFELEIEFWRKKMQSLYRNLDHNKCWYYKEEKGFFKRPFNGRLKEILLYAKYYQKIELQDYQVSFAAPSKGLHPNPLINEMRLTLQCLENAITRVSSLILQVITELIDLIDEQSPEGVLKKISYLIKNNKFPEEHLDRTLINPDIKIDDLVLVYGCFVARVIGEKIGKYGYKTYSIKYIEQTPSLKGTGMDGIEDECVASNLRLIKQEDIS